jgi:ABC-type nitrate/sulfonate/bicarbonate transport system substrate-binding protein
MNVLIKKLPLFIFVLAMLLASSARAQEKTKFPIAESTKTLSYAPLWVALREGFFDQQGLDVQLITMRGSPLTVQALAAGSIYVGAATTDTIIGSVEKGLNLVMVGGLINGLNMALVGGKKYKTFADLRGATIGSLTLTSGTGFALRLLLKAHGLEYPRDYTLLNVGGSSDRITALASGQIAAAPLGSPLDIKAEEMGFNIIGRFIDAIPDYQLNVLTVVRPWAAKNRNLVVRFMKAMVLADRWLYGNETAAVSLLSKEMNLKPDLARKGVESSIKYKIWDPNGRLNVEGLKMMIKIYAEISKDKSPLPSPSKYTDDSYLNEALKELGEK